MNLAEIANSADDNDEAEAVNIEEHRALLERYPADPREIPNWIGLKEIIVETERDKQQILQALKYLHDNKTIDTDYLAVNTLVHMYTVPERIKVQP